MPDTYTSQFSGEEIDAALRAAQIISGADTPAAVREKLEIYGSNTALSPTDPTTVETALKYRSNPNLLDNWYFGRLVNQRDGYLPKDIFVKVYNDVTCTDYAGPVNYYPSLIKESNGNFKYNSGSNVFYIKAEDTVSGYANFGYTVDRWKLLMDATNLLIKTGYISLTAATSDYGGFMQLFEAEPLLGQTVTFSALCRYTGSGGNTLPYITAYCGDNVYDGSSQINSTDWMLVSFTHTFPETKPNDNRFGFDIVTMKSFGVDIKAAKLELGDAQTLAHKENGVWVLNEIPDFGEQLRRCQTYYLGDTQRDGYGKSTSNNEISVVIPLPATMRAKPVIASSSKWGNLISGDGEITGISSIEVAALMDNLVILRVVTNTTISTNKAFIMSDTRFALSADL